jgi:hypothetical protein
VVLENQTWPTPQSRDERGPTGSGGRLDTNGRRSSLSDAAMPGATAGRLNPAWVATLMGFPSTWLDTPSPPVEAKPSYAWEATRAVGGDVKVPDRPAKLRALGNAVVPQCGLVVGRILIAMGA